MDESMNSVHSISAMDISPASSPIVATNSAPLNSSVLTAFQHQQQLLSNVLFSTTKTSNTIEESNEIRQRIVTDPLATISETKTEIKIEIKPKKTSTTKMFLPFGLVVVVLLYFFAFSSTKLSIVSEKSTLKNVTDYLHEHLFGQEKGLQAFENALAKHKNFSVILIEGPIGVGKTYLASTMEKFVRTSLLSIDTLLGLSAHHWTEPSNLTFYLAGHLTDVDLKFLILDDVDLLPSNETYCRTLIDALENLSKNRNLFVLLFKTEHLSKFCENELTRILTEKIRFEPLRREDVRRCVEREAFLQNVQPDLTDEQIKIILDSIVYFQDQGVSYASTGCKQISSLVMLHSRKQLH